MNDRNYKYLDKIDLPKDLRKFEKNDLENICNDLREFIINSISENAGHFGATLGVVELTVALHYVYNTPEDSIVWDVGHQAYGHKILTGRKRNFTQIEYIKVYLDSQKFQKVSTILSALDTPQHQYLLLLVWQLPPSIKARMIDNM